MLKNPSRSDIYEQINLGKGEEISREDLESEYLRCVDDLKRAADTLLKLTQGAAKSVITINALMSENSKLSNALREAVKNNLRRN